MTDGLDLGTIFKAVTGNLKQNQAELDQADTFNHDHGTHMVELFDLISKAVQSAEVKNASPSEKLDYASRFVGARAKSGSAQAYTSGLEQAARQLKGQPAITPDNIILLINALLGGITPTGKQSATAGSAGADLLGALLGGGQSSAATGAGADLLGALLGGAAQGSGQSSAGGDLLGALLGGAAGKAGGADGLDLGDVISAGMGYLDARQKGKSGLEAILGALVGNSSVAKTPHRQKSASIVADALLQAVLSGMSR